MLQGHVIRSPHTSRPEGSCKLEPAFAQPFSPKPSGRPIVSSLDAKFLAAMRVFEELCRNVQNFFKSPDDNPCLAQSGCIVGAEDPPQSSCAIRGCANESSLWPPGSSHHTPGSLSQGFCMQLPSERGE